MCDASESEGMHKIYFALRVDDVGLIDALADKLGVVGYHEIDRKSHTRGDLFEIVTFRSNTCTTNLKSRISKVIFNRANYWSFNPFDGELTEAEEASVNGYDVDIDSYPLIYRIDSSELPGFLIPAVAPDDVKYNYCRVINSFNSPENAGDTLLRKLGLSPNLPEIDVAESLLVQSAWSINLLYRYAKMGRVTTISALLHVDPSLDQNLASLICSVVNKDADALQRVLLLNTEIDLKSVRLPGGNSLLHFAACIPGCTEVLRVLLSHGADIEARNDFGSTPVLLAPWGDSKSAIYLLNQGADPLVVDFYGDTALHPAAWLGQYELVTRLLDAGTQPFITNSDNGHALIYAARAGHTDIIDLILKRFPGQIDVPTGAYGLGSDNHALASDFTRLPAILQYRLRRLADSGRLGKTALMAAAESKRLKTTQFLLTLGADPNLADRQGHTSLLNALNYKSPRASIINALIKRRANLEAADDEGYTPFIAASMFGEFDIVELLNAKGANINAKDKMGQTSLHHAAAFGRVETISLLARLNVDPSPWDDKGFTPLHLAVEFPDASGAAVEALVRAGSKPDELTRDKRTPLMLALTSERSPAQRAAITKVLLELGADPNLESPPHRSAFFQAVAMGQEEIVDVLLSTVSRIPINDEHQATPLHAAVVNGLDGILHRLIGALRKSGISVDIKDETGETALHEAVRHRNRQAWFALLEAGADPWLVSNGGQIPALEAALTGLTEYCSPLLDSIDLDKLVAFKSERVLAVASAMGRADVVRRLIERETCIDVRLPGKWRPLSVASFCGQAEIVGILLEHGACVNWRSDVPTALSCAAENGHEDIIRKLVSANADPNAPASDERTPLIFAAAHNKVGAVRLLLEAGAFSGARDLAGRTSLHIAADGGYLEIIRVLLEAKVNPNTLDDDGHSPLFLAVSRGSLPSVELLLHYEADPNFNDDNGLSVAEIAGEKAILDLLLHFGASYPRIRQSEASRATFLQWKPVKRDRVVRLRQKLEEVGYLLGEWGREWLREAANVGVKEAQLPFYDNGYIVSLVNNSIPPPNEKFFIWSMQESFLKVMDWTNEPIYSSNEILQWRIDGSDATVAKIYIKLFFFFVRGNLGRFEIYEAGEHLNWLDGADSDTISRTESKLIPIQVLSESPNGTMSLRFTCVFKDALFMTDAYIGLRWTSFVIDGEIAQLNAGQIMLTNEKVLEENLPIYVSGPPTEFG